MRCGVGAFFGGWCGGLSVEVGGREGRVGMSVPPVPWLTPANS